MIPPGAMVHPEMDAPRAVVLVVGAGGAGRGGSDRSGSDRGAKQPWAKRTDSGSGSKPGEKRL